MPDVWTMLLVASVAGAITGLGALPVFFRLDISHRVYDAGLGLAAGIMVSASVFGLIIPGAEEGTLGMVVVGIGLGGAALLVGNRLMPHVHARYRGFRPHGGATPDANSESALRRALLIGGAIVLHNAPEGLALGIAFASGLSEVAYLIAIVIAIQNIPDGFAFAVPFGDTDVSRGRLLVYTTLSGLLPEAAAALFGFALVALATGIFPIAAGFAAGAMLAVVFREMVPSSHGHGHADAATIAFLAGFVLLFGLEALLTV